MALKNADQFTFRWLGVAGLEFCFQDKNLLVDPYLTRVSKAKFLFEKIETNKILLKSLVKKADGVLVTHAHFDHLLDVPEIIKMTNALVAGSLNTQKILKAAGVQESKITLVDSKKIINWSEFLVSTKPITHLKIPGYGYGQIKEAPILPMRAGKYKMDVDYQYKIQVAGKVFLTEIGKNNLQTDECDVLFLYAFHANKYLKKVLSRIKTKNIVFIHWDDFFQSLNSPQESLMTKFNRWSLRKTKRFIEKFFAR